MLTIVIAEDVELEREGLVNSIRWDQLGIQVAGAAEDGVEAWELIERHRPDIVLTDIKMPIRDGIELAKQVAAAYPQIKIMFFSGHEDFNFALEAIKTKASEYVLKPYTIQEITDALYKVASACRLEREKLLEEQRMKTRLAQLLGKDAILDMSETEDAEDFSRISKIVNQVKQMIAEKYRETITLEDLAATMFLSPNYLNSIFKKATGSSINKYVIEVRIAEAMKLLTEPEAVIGRVAEQVGYRNVAHFSTLFRKQTGLSPMTYREDHTRTRILLK